MRHTLLAHTARPLRIFTRHGCLHDGYKEKTRYCFNKPQTIDMNLGQAHCLVSRAPTQNFDWKSPKVGSLLYRDSSELQLYYL